MVYVISDGSKYVKIGVSNNVPRRLNGLQVGNPHQLKTLLIIDCECDYDLESALHKHFKKHRVKFGNRFKSEWFEESVLQDIQNMTVNDLHKLCVNDIGVINIIPVDKASLSMSSPLFNSEDTYKHVDDFKQNTYDNPKKINSYWKSMANGCACMFCGQTIINYNISMVVDKFNYCPVCGKYMRVV